MTTSPGNIKISTTSPILNTKNITTTAPSPSKLPTPSSTPSESPSPSESPTPIPMDETPMDFHSLFYTIFNKSNFVLFLWFLAIYMIAYFLIAMFSKGGSENTQFQLRFSRMIDFVFLFVLLVIAVTTFFSVPSGQKEDYIESTVSSTISFVDQPISLLSTILFIFAFYLTIFVLQIPMTRETKPIFIMLIESVLWLFMLLIVFFDFFKYVLGISPTSVLQNMDLWHSLPDNPPTKMPNPSVAAASASAAASAASSSSSSSSLGKEVFNISNNLYTYDDAQSICSAYGATIATYDQVEDSYNHGGEWCNYGWSDGQMALFPTQKTTWKELQKDPKKKNNCGRPGINGGYMSNPNIKFGVNCYGKKPTPSPLDLTRLNQKQNQPIPTTAADKKVNEKVQYWKDHAATLLQINSYNNKQWSEMGTSAVTTAPATTMPISSTGPYTTPPSTPTPFTTTPPFTTSPSITTRPI